MNTSIKFFVKQVKNKNQRLPIYLRVIHNGKKSEGKTVLSPITEELFKRFNETEQRFENALPNHNKYISKVHHKFEEILYLDDTIANISCITLRDKLLKRGEGKSLGLITAYDNYIQNTIIPKKDMAAGTKRNYQKSFNHFEAFLKTCNNSNIYLKELTKEDATKFIDYLQSIMTDVSAHGVLKNVKPFFRRMLDTDKIDKNPFEGMIIKYEKKEVNGIETPHFKSIKNLSLKNFENLELYVDIFLFLSYTGMSYCDFKSFDRNKLYTKNGYTFLKYIRIKSGIPSIQVLTDGALKILRKYETNQQVQIYDTLLPKVGLNEVNKIFKNIGHRANLPMPLITKHTRRFFRQSLYDSNCSSEELVKKILMGHARGKDITGSYLMVKDEMLIDASEKLNIFYNKI